MDVRRITKKWKDEKMEGGLLKTEGGLLKMKMEKWKEGY